MKDLDFDELDRAVSSLMGGVAASDGKPDGDEHQEAAALTPDAVEATATKEEAPSEVPSETTAAETDEAAQDTAEDQPAKIVAHARGRFMDIVPGSATKSARPAAETTDSAKKPVIQPSAKFEQSVREDAADDHEASQIVDQPTGETADAPESVADPSAIATPFLADAKIEKRPLGGAALSTGSNVPDQDTPNDTDRDDKVADQSTDTLDNDQQVGVPTQMPAELSSEIVSVEAGGVIVDPDIDDKSAAAPDSETPSSIPQQYKTAESALQVDDQPKATIYDAHQLAAPLKRKKHTGGWILLIILLCILVGASGGYLAYSFRLFG